MPGKLNISDKITEKVEEDFRDIEVEYQLMSYIVRTNPTASSMMKKDWLSDIILQNVFEVVADLRMTLTKAMLLRELKQRSLIGKDELGLFEEAIDSLYDVDIAQFNDKNARRMMALILSLSESRRILVGCGKLVGDMKSFDVEKAKSILTRLSRPASLVDRENSGFYLDDYGERVEILDTKQKESEKHDEVEVGIPTGIFRFDRMCGGIMKKEFGVVAGVTGVGKTTGLICFGIHAWDRGYDVMIVSGEMAKDLLEFRIDSHLTGISGMRFRNADLEDAEYATWDSTIKKYRAKQSENFLYVATYPRRFTAETVEKDMIRLQEESGRKVDVLCLDYLNIMDPMGKKTESGKEWTSQAEAVWDLKGMVSEYDLVCWTAGQVRDEAFDKEIYDLSDLKYARAISETAPVVIALIRSPKDIIENRMKLQVLKMRNAPLPKKPIVLTPKLDVMKIHEEATGMKTLKGKQPDMLDMKKETKKSRPKKTLHGKK